MSEHPKGLVFNINDATISNTHYRKVIFTAPHMQIVLMSLKYNEAISMEVHEHTEQFVRVEAGKGVVIVDGTIYEIGDDDAVIIPAGTRHLFRATSPVGLKLYTIYSSAEHPAGLIEN